jgi:uroporphyrinogen-III decarboxylase
VFNLGHGVLPRTPPETLERLVELVHDRTSRVEATS